MKTDSRWVAIGAVFAMLAVIIGAFAAHGLRSMLAENLMSVFQTGVQYQTTHAFALIALGLWSERHPSPRLCWIGLCFTAGIFIFSGSLYLLSLSGNHKLGMVTPIGGMLFIVGWLLFALEAMRAR